MARNEVENKKGKALKIAGIILLILIIIVAGVGIGGYSYVAGKLGKMQQVEINEEELDIDVNVAENLSEYRNIAIFGIDSREDDFGKGNRSDCILIASINNKTKDVRLISVYRDTYVQIEGHGLDKITHAYSYGGAPLAISTLNTNLDLNIKEFVTVNFDSVGDAVDALGGVEIDVQKNEIQNMNDHLRWTPQYAGENVKYITKAGLQTLNGMQAVSYARVRFTEGGDYKRTERIRTVIMAIVDKLKTKSIGEINSFLDTILPKVYTNVSANNIISLVPDAMNYKFQPGLGWPYETRGYTGAAWYGVPVTLESNVSKLHHEIFGEVEYEPTETVKTISNKIIKTTGYRE